MGFAVVFVATFGPVIFAMSEASEVSATAAEATPNRSTERSDYASVRKDDLPMVAEYLKAEPKGPNRSKGGCSASITPGGELQRRPNLDAPSNVPNRRLTLGEIRTDLMVRSATGRAFGSQKKRPTITVTRSRATPTVEDLGDRRAHSETKDDRQSSTDAGGAALGRQKNDTAPALVSPAPDFYPHRSCVPVFRCSPQSRHWSRPVACPFRAMSGHQWLVDSGMVTFKKPPSPVRRFSRRTRGSTSARC